MGSGIERSRRARARALARALPATAAAIVLALGLGGCASASGKTPTAESTPASTEDDLFAADVNVEASISTFFAYLAARDAEAAAEQTDLDIDLESPLAMLLSPEVYASVEGQPELLDIADISVSDDEDHATATVTYLLVGSELTEQIELVRIGEYDDKPDDYGIVLSDEAVGFDTTGAELLPPETTYSIGGWDVTAAFREAVGWADGDGALPRLPAFGGTYPVEITVPGDGGFTETLVLESSTFFGGDGADGALEAFAHAHGF